MSTSKILLIGAFLEWGRERSFTTREIMALSRIMQWSGNQRTFRTVLKDALNPKPKVEKPKKGAKSEATTETPAPATEPPAPPVNGAKPKSKKPQVNKNRLEHQLKDKRAQLARNGVKVEVAA